MKRLSIFKAIETYVELCERMVHLEYDLSTTLDGREKKKNKLEPEVIKAAQVVNRKIKRLHDQAAKARRSDPGKGTAKRT